MNYNHHYFKNQSQQTNNGYSVSNKRKYAGTADAGTAVPCNAGTVVPCNPTINNQGGWKGHSPSASLSNNLLYDFKTTEIALKEIKLDQETILNFSDVNNNLLIIKEIIKK